MKYSSQGYTSFARFILFYLKWNLALGCYIIYEWTEHHIHIYERSSSHLRKLYYSRQNSRKSFHNNSIWSCCRIQSWLVRVWGYFLWKLHNNKRDNLFLIRQQRHTHTFQSSISQPAWYFLHTTHEFISNYYRFRSFFKKFQ
jgi:hypothetical protein